MLTPVMFKYRNPCQSFLICLHIKGTHCCQCTTSRRLWTLRSMTSSADMLLMVMRRCCAAGHLSDTAVSTGTVVATVAASVSSAAVAAAPTVESIALSLAFGVAACALGEGLATAVGLPSINLAAMAVVASVFASVGSAVSAKAGQNASSPFRGRQNQGACDTC